MPAPRTFFRGARSSLVSGLVLALVGALLLAVVPSLRPSRADAAAPQRLTNLDHLDFLGDRVSPPKQARHTTYRLAQEPGIGTLWTYADRHDDGSYRRVGGGDHDAATDTYTQGAFNADDMARAAVVYLRHWKQTGHRSSRTAAYEMLRGLTYLQTTTGPNAGNVVLWMQPDGTLNREREAGRAAGPLGQRRVVLAGPDHLGARRGLRGLPARRPRVRAVRQAAARPRHRRARPSGARQVRAAT